MIDVDEVRRLVAQSGNTLTIYLDVNPAAPGNQAAVEPTWRIWLKNALHQVQDSMSEEKANGWREVRRRAEDYFRLYRPQSLSLVAFFTAEGDHIYPLPIPFENRIAYGPPRITPLIWALDEYEPYLITLVDSKEARFVVSRLNVAAGQDLQTLHLDTSDWRRTTVKPASSQPGSTAQGSSNRDDYDHRVEEHQQRFWRDVAQHLETMMREEKLSRLVLGGTEVAVHAVRSLLPKHLEEAVVAVLPISPQTSDHEMLARVLPVAIDGERSHEAELVDFVVDEAKSGGRAALGVEAVEKAIREGRAETVIGAWPAADEARLEQLARQAIERGVILDFVEGSAADKLRAEGDVAALLYYAPPVV